MFLAPLKKEDFTFQGKLSIDTQNKGFTDSELQTIALQAPDDGNAKGLFGTNVWKRDRPVNFDMQQVKSEIGYQSSPVLANLADVAEAEGKPLDGLIKVMSKTYNFYVMNSGVFIFPQDNETIDALKFEIYYKDPLVATYAMFPAPKQKERFKVGVQAKLGVTGKAAFDFPKIPISPAAAELNVKAEVDSQFIVSFDYEYKTPVIDAFGTNNQFCRWMIYEGQDLRNDVQFFPIIRTPKNMTSIDCEFRVYVKINKSWQHSEIFAKEPYKVTVM